MSITVEQMLNEQYCLKLYNNPKAFAKFDASVQGKLLAVQPSIMQMAIQDNRFMEMDSHVLNNVATYYTINAAPFGENKAKNGYVYLGRNRATEEAREQICFDIARKPALIAKLNPAARILFFANLKKSNTFKEATEKNELKILEVSLEVLSQIQNAYDIRTDYNPEGELGRWKADIGIWQFKLKLK